MIRVLIIIESANLSDAKALALNPPFNLDAALAAQLFVPAGSATGDLPASHYWASGQFTEEQAAAFLQLAPALPWAQTHEYDLFTQPSFPQEVLTAMGLQPLTPQTP